MVSSPRIKGTSLTPSVANSRQHKNHLCAQVRVFLHISYVTISIRSRDDGPAIFYSFSTTHLIRGRGDSLLYIGSSSLGADIEGLLGSLSVIWAELSHCGCCRDLVAGIRWDNCTGKVYSCRFGTQVRAVHLSHTGIGTTCIVVCFVSYKLVLDYAGTLSKSVL